MTSAKGTVIEVGEVFAHRRDPGVTVALENGEQFSMPVSEGDAKSFSEALYIKDGVTLTLEVDDHGQRPTIVCLVGSTRFFEAYQRANFEETMAGRIVLSVAFCGGPVHGETMGITPEKKLLLDELHMRKIEMADEVLVVSVDGYIGESTRREIAHARELGKTVRYFDGRTT